MSPIDLPEEDVRGVLLVEDMICSIEIEEAMGLVGPVGRRQQVISRSTERILKMVVRNAQVWFLVHSPANVRLKEDGLDRF